MMSGHERKIRKSSERVTETLADAIVGVETRIILVTTSYADRTGAAPPDNIRSWSEMFDRLASPHF